jgi:hypothetical protein
MVIVGVLPSTKKRSLCSKPASVKRLDSYILLFRRTIVDTLFLRK